MFHGMFHGAGVALRMRDRKQGMSGPTSLSVSGEGPGAGKAMGVGRDPGAGQPRRSGDLAEPINCRIAYGLDPVDLLHTGRWASPVRSYGTSPSSHALRRS